MAWAATADPERFEEAIAWFRSKFPLTEELLQDLEDFAGPRAWSVAGVTQLDVVLRLYESISKAIEDGTSIDDWKKTAREILSTAGARTKATLDTIFRTNVQSAYNRGRWVQMHDPEVKRFRPYGMFDAILDSRTTDVCEHANKTLLPLDDPWWASHLPPLHFQCRSSVRNLNQREVDRRGGITTTPPDDPVPDGFGEEPTAAEWTPDPSSYPADLWAIFEERQARSA